MKKIFLGLIFSLICTFGFTQNQILNGDWAFRIDPNEMGESQGWFKTDYLPTNWDEMPVPGNWDLRNEYAHYAGKAWYRRTFLASPAWKDKIVRLYFEAVYHESKVWLNGELLGTNSMGFLPFEFEISSKIDWNGQNTLVVSTDNTFKRGAIWNWGGIRRPVTILVNESLRITYQHITPTLDLANGTAKVAVKLFVQNHSNQAKIAEGFVTILGKNLINKKLPFKITIPANSTQSTIVQLIIAKNEAHLWHFDDPFLYESKVKLNGSNEITNRFGLRKIKLDNINYTLKLNGESIRPMGFNLVPDDRTTGNTLPLWRIKEDIDMLKSVGCNMARLSHLILPEEVLDYLDERGIMVISEIPLWGFDILADPDNPTPKDWLSRMIKNQYNHPSVIAWSVGNELGDFPKTMKYAENSTAFVRTLDSTRFVTTVSHTADRSPDFIQYSDIGLINKYYKNLGPVTEAQHKLYPNKILFYSEYGISQSAENLDANFPVKVLLDSIRNRPYLIGASLWTFNDYRSTYNGTKEFSENRPWGIVDVFRRKKQSYYDNRKELSPLKEFKVTIQNKNSATLNIQARTKYDLPAFPIHNYKYLWKLCNSEGKILQGGFQNLPNINPDGKAFQESIKWTTSDAYYLNVALLTPQMDAVIDTTIYFQKPFPIKILQSVGTRTYQNHNRNNSGRIRIYFEQNPTATAYKVKYGLTDLNLETTKTIENFIDIPKLPFQEKYNFSLIGINNAGESTSSIQTIKIEDEDFAPPAIRRIEAADRGFFVGYATENDDFLFRVQITTKSGDYSDAKIIQSTSPGVMFIPNLINGETYYFRVQRMTDSHVESLWTSERSIVPDGGITPKTPEILGIIRQGRETIISYLPAYKSTGYELCYRPDNGKNEDWKSFSISTALLENFLVKNLDPKQKYQFRLAAKNAYGTSDFSEIKTVQKSSSK